jgi:prepilin-type N-terminal cleavage/methylation domain-containing protein
MRSSIPSIWCSRRFRERRRRQARGFTLVEIMVVVTIISFLAMMAVPTIRKLQLKARASTTANNLRVFETAFQTYANERGGFPAAADPGELPPQMVGRIKETDWSKVSPLGGHYAWESNQVFGGVTCKAAISINTTGDSALASDADQLQTLDRMVDDGNLNTGNLIFAGSGSLVWIIER